MRDTPHLAGVLFDLDGTLVDTAPDLVGALNRLLHDLDLSPVPLESARSLVSEGGRALIRHGFRCNQRPLDEGALEKYFDQFLVLYRQRISEQSRVFTGAETALDRLLARGSRLAVVTNKPTLLAEQLLDALDLGRYFSAVAGGDRWPQRKPDPEPIMRTLALIGVRPQWGIMIGDHVVDMKAAENAGIGFIGVDFGYSPDALRSQGATHMIRDFSELPAAISRVMAACE